MTRLFQYPMEYFSRHKFSSDLVPEDRNIASSPTNYPVSWKIIRVYRADQPRTAGPNPYRFLLAKSLSVSGLRVHLSSGSIRKQARALPQNLCRNYRRRGCDKTALINRQDIGSRRARLSGMSTKLFQTNSLLQKHHM